MRTGTIVYLAEATGVPLEWNEARALEQAGLDPAWVELAGAAPGFYHPEEALLALARRGAAHVELVAARCGKGGAVELGASKLRWVG